MTNKYLNQLADTFLKFESRKEVTDFLKGIMTPQELIEIPQRLEIVRRLKQGDTQRKIAEDLGVGIATVTRGSRELKKGRFK
ncbi:MAG: transcriptional regulator [Candidatus Pacebacteria bacterium CG10_big_fil_rev_8_21_14_0_10_42_12]|nr:transcriptional regulator [Candidatus Parcubacteria bacterium]PIR63037.1 MAG: transcriptional regulator [Candidatus Pacebacteria bacterium CG10_big_fil_rev_8_21_14_0_10_42_12]